MELGKAAQLCVFILGTPYLYLGVLSVGLSMGVWYTDSSLAKSLYCTHMDPGFQGSDFCVQLGVVSFNMRFSPLDPC